jgi:hypothetical protein
MKKNRETDIIFYVISDKTAILNASNIEIINEVTELHYDDIYNVTFIMLREDRKKTMGGGNCGMFKKKDDVEFLVFPTTKMGFIVNEDNEDVIKEYSYNEYKELVWDIEEEIEV